jgi:hypothetical protein
MTSLLSASSVVWAASVAWPGCRWPGVLPGRTVDITAARRFKIAEKVLQFRGCWSTWVTSACTLTRSSVRPWGQGRPGPAILGPGSVRRVRNRDLTEIEPATHDRLHHPKGSSHPTCVSTLCPARSRATHLRK